jgi:hypothetical protein
MSTPVGNTAATSNGVMTSSNQTNLEDNLFKEDSSSGGGQSKKGECERSPCCSALIDLLGGGRGVRGVKPLLESL